MIKICSKIPPLRGVFLSLLYLLSSSFFVSTAEANNVLCKDLFKIIIDRSPIDTSATTPVSFIIQQPTAEGRYGPTVQENPITEYTGGGFYFRARYEADKGGGIELNVFLVNNTINRRSSISGKKSYDEMMDYFSEKPIRYIRGIWSSGDNYTEYLYNLTELGMSRRDAALNTWSGRQAQRYGFKYVKILSDKIYEEDYPYTHVVNVVFYDKMPNLWQSFKDFWQL